MAPPRLPTSVMLEALAAVREYGNIAAASRALGLPQGTFHARFVAARKADRDGTLSEKQFEYGDLPDEQPAAADLLARRRVDYERKHKAAEARRLIPIRIKVDGPIGIAHFGDPHVDDDGTNIELLEQHVKVVNATDGLFAANVGDYRNNWVGRLARLWADQSTSAKESLVLARWLVEAMDWLYLIGGNHDAWSGADDPIAWIAEQVGALHQPFAARLELEFPNKRKIRVNARHDFRGHSEWNSAHGPAKAARIGWRDHLLTCGHRHISGYNVLKDPASGLISHAIRVASYKLHDRYAIEQGLPDQNIFLCPVTIIDPRFADDDPRLVTTIFDPHVGADFLTFLRKRGNYGTTAVGRNARRDRRPRRRR
jgi:hypothetical protein